MTWGIEELDLDAYLRRIGVTDPTLRSVHAGHVASIPFENIKVFTGTVPTLDIPSLQAKMVDRDRGGYCFEQNLLYTAALERLGIPVRRLLARPRISGGPVRGRTHMMAVAEVDGRQWLTDVGWGGGGLLEPMPFEEGTMQQGAWTYRLTRVEEQWVLQSLTAGKWVDYYGFTTERQYMADYEMGNFYAAREPSSHWLAQLVAQRTGPEFRQGLVGYELIKARPSGEVEKRTLTADEIFEVLPGTFGIDLTDAERDQLRQRI